MASQRRNMIRAVFIEQKVLADLLAGFAHLSSARVKNALLEVFWHFGENDESRRELLQQGLFQLMLSNMADVELFDTIVGG